MRFSLALYTAALVFAAAPSAFAVPLHTISEPITPQDIVRYTNIEEFAPAVDSWRRTHSKRGPPLWSTRSPPQQQQGGQQGQEQSQQNALTQQQQQVNPTAWSSLEGNAAPNGPTRSNHRTNPFRPMQAQSTNPFLSQAQSTNPFLSQAQSTNPFRSTQAQSTNPFNSQARAQLAQPASNHGTNPFVTQLAHSQSAQHPSTNGRQSNNP
ncbi:hypothetical protein K474DRAFT_1680235 [Panus rudis PR-1116 ss-1]|nr:hypothetical protein K474DRAFT_1680235 [Panus rudis PR-1116 ss-1]